MTDFHDVLIAIHGEIWEGGTEPRAELCAMLKDLEQAKLPGGVTRLPSAAMAPGPHLAAQDDFGDISPGIVWLEAGRLSHARAQRFAVL